MRIPPTTAAEIYADLHLHTNKSDGRLAPAELVSRAAERGLSVIAITDHDTIAGLEVAARAVDGAALQLVSGVELSVTLEGARLHLLAYGFDPTDEALNERLREMEEARRARAWSMVERLQSLGLDVVDRELRTDLSSRPAVGRPHIAAALVRAGHVDRPRAAFEQYIGEDGPGYVPTPQWSARDALDRVHDAGGIGVLAHPGHWTRSTQIRRLVEAGLDGLELYHPSHDRSLRRYYRRIARSYDLLCTGGSDFHGRSDAEQLGTVGLQREEWERFRAALS